MPRLIPSLTQALSDQPARPRPRRAPHVVGHAADLDALRAARRRALIVLAAVAWTIVLGLWAAPARANTLYGCEDIDRGHAFASLEGDGGQFFRIVPDLLLAPVLSDDTIIHLAALSEALAARGTRLIVVPLPGKGMVLPGALPAAARDLGFDAGLAATLHDDVLDRLSDAGVTTVNARRALRSRTDAPTMFGTDPRLTPAGVQALARAIGSVIVQDPDLALLPRGTWTTRTTAPVALPSALRTALQRHCRLTLPEVVAEGSATLRVDAATGATDTTLLGPQAAAGQIALLATLEAGDHALNLAGHLAQASGLPVQAYAVGWGDEPGAALAAISSYMTSPAFDTSPPAIIVWTFPMAAPLAQQGDGPLRELIAAARGGCTTPLAPVAGTRPGSVAFALPGLDPAAPGMLMVDLGPVAATRIEVAFQGPDGTLRSRFATRHPGQIATGRFFVPLDGLWPQGALAVTVQADVAPGAGLRAALCPPPPLVQP